MSNCKIILTDDRNYCGTKLSGRLICVFTSEKNVRNIKVRLKGKEHTEWLLSESYYDQERKEYRSHNVTHTGDNEVISCELMVWSGHGGSTIPAGTHTYDFEFLLPKTLPSSFDGTYGSIKYSVKGIVDRPMRPDYECKKFFRLISPIDFNELPSNLQDPTAVEDEKYTCCLCCTQGPIQADMTVERRAVTLGENMNIIVNLTNMSNTNVESTNIRLTQTITSRVNSPKQDTKTEVDLLNSLDNHGVGAHGSFTYNLRMDIPHNLVLVNFHCSSIFRVAYSLTATFELAGCHSNLELDMPLTLGNIKFNDHNVVTIVPTPTASAPYPPPNPLCPPYPVNASPFPMPIGFTAPQKGGQNLNGDEDEWEDIGDEQVENRTPSAPPPPASCDMSAPPPSYDEVVKSKY